MTHIEEWMREKYDASAQGYRQDDERDATGGDHRDLAEKLAAICASFQRSISVLDIGCGTGRYFHALKNVDKLVGMDVSREMLARARYPVKADELSIREIELKCANFYKGQFPPASFDFIYAIGVFGNGCPITAQVARQFLQWLKPDGRLFFDVLDSTNLPVPKRFRKWARRTVYSALSGSLQRRWDQRAGWPPMFLISRSALLRLIKRGGFAAVKIERCFTRLPLGDAWKHECLAVKNYAS